MKKSSQNPFNNIDSPMTPRAGTQKNYDLAHQRGKGSEPPCPVKNYTPTTATGLPNAKPMTTLGRPTGKPGAKPAAKIATKTATQAAPKILAHGAPKIASNTPAKAAVTAAPKAAVKTMPQMGRGRGR